jgi:hypothetical protein
MAHPESPNQIKVDILSISLFLVLGLINLPCPFTGDQALFTTGAKAISNGSILYRDFWDIKQPGIYDFYLLGGLLFGFNEVGVHLFELIYMVMFYLTLRMLLKDYFNHPVFRSIFPLFPLGAYYSVAKPWHLTQVEILVSFPLFLSLFCAVRSIREDEVRLPSLFISGLAGGIVLFFKLAFLPIICIFWVMVCCAALLWRIERPLALLIKMGVMIPVGLCIPVFIVLGYFLYWGLGDILYKTSFIYPFQIKEMKRLSITKLKVFIEFFLGTFTSMMAIGVFGINLSKRKSDTLLTIGFVMWFVIGLAVVFAQGYWPYHAYLVMVPLGILCAKGLEFLWLSRNQFGYGQKPGKVAVIVSLAILFSPILAPLIYKSIVLAKYDFALDGRKRFLYQCAINRDYEKIAKNVAFLSESTSLKGPIYVLGDPLYYLLSGRAQGIPINGWSPENFLEEQWGQLNRQLIEMLPCYIFVDVRNLKLISERSPSTLEFILQNYTILDENKFGAWYEIA